MSANFFMRISPQRLLYAQYTVICVMMIIVCVLSWALSIIVHLYTHKINLFTATGKQRKNIIIWNSLLSVLFLMLLIQIPPLDMETFYFIRKHANANANTNNVMFPDRHERYLQLMKKRPAIYQYSGPHHDKVKKAMVFDYSIFSYLVFVFAAIQWLVTILIFIKDDSYLAILLSKYSQYVLICQMASLSYAIVLLIGRITSGWIMCAYRSYQAVKVIPGKDFANVIDRKHFMKEYSA